MKLSDVLSSLAAPFKTLPQATAAIEPAKATLDSVNALFTAAGLNLETMLAAGPDSLKAHIEGLNSDTELAEALLENEKLEADLSTATASLTEFGNRQSAFVNAFASLGLTLAADTKPEDIKAAWESHVAKATTVALAKTGHPPAHIPASSDASAPILTDEQIAAEYSAMASGPSRLDFYSKHEAALRRAEAKAKRTA